MKSLPNEESARPAGLRSSSFLAAGSVTASAIVTGFSLLATILILRFLSQEDAGRFAVLVELLYALGLLGSLGQAFLQARLYYQEGAEHFDWRADLRSTIWITTPAIALGLGALALPYRLSIFQAAYLLVGAELFVLTNCISAVLAQQRRYAWSSALLRLPNGLLILPALLMAVSHFFVRLDLVLVSFLVFLFLTTVLGIRVLARTIQPGDAHINLRQRRSGLVFLFAMIALLVPQRGLIVVAGALLSPENVAALAAFLALLRFYELIGDPAGRVFSTEMAQHSGRISFGLLSAPWLLAVVISTLALLVFPQLAHHFYNGRYDFALSCFSWLVVAAALRFVEIVPRGYLGYVAPGAMLNRFSAVQCGIAIVGLIVMIKWTTGYGLRGIVWASVLIAAARTTVSYVLLGQVLHARKAGAPLIETRDGAFIKELEVGGEEPPV